MTRYRRFSSRSYGAQRAAQHIADRHALTRSFGGIDQDVERIFLHLHPRKLEIVLAQYERAYGTAAASYARATYPRWRSGATKMSGTVAERLLNLVPRVLDGSARFELVKKLRKAHMPRQVRRVNCSPADWQAQLAPVVEDVVAASGKFQLPQQALDRVHWLADGDAVSAHNLLAAAEQEEAAVRLRYLESEFQRIDHLVRNIESLRVLNHAIELPQGTINVSISLPRKGFWGWLQDLLS